MIKETISTATARRFYNQLGTHKDRSERFEHNAKTRALDLLALAPGQRVLNVGVGTGKDHMRIQNTVAPDGVAIGLDLAGVMLGLTQAATDAPLIGADTRNLPFIAGSFDRLFSSYVLDLIPLADLPGILRDFHRVLKPNGRMVLVSLTEGVDLSSHAFMLIWKLAYAINPIACGGCRPLQLSTLVRQADFTLVRREVIVQSGFPSEIIVATR